MKLAITLLMSAAFAQDVLSGSQSMSSSSSTHNGETSSSFMSSSSGGNGPSSSGAFSSSGDGNSMAQSMSGGGDGGGSDYGGTSTEAFDNGGTGSTENSAGSSSEDDGGSSFGSSSSMISSSSDDGASDDDDFSDSSMSASAISSRCQGHVCKLIINGKKYKSSDGSYAKSMMKSGCPPAFCSKSCNFVQHTDNCPMCKCDGYGAREPCESSADCTGAGSTGCQKGVCTYPEPAGRAMKTCAMTWQCAEDEDCESGMCRPTSRRHTGKQCMFDHQCPETYYCDKQKMVCYETGGDRHSKKQCVMDQQCGPGQHCRSSVMTCYYN